MCSENTSVCSLRHETLVEFLRMIAKFFSKRETISSKG